MGQWQHNLKKFTNKTVKTKQNKKKIIITRASMIYKGGKAGNCANIVSSSLKNLLKVYDEMNAKPIEEFHNFRYPQ